MADPNTTGIPPLRKIVREEKSETGLWRDVLECGHLVAQAEDIYGKRHPMRRRCKKCASGKSVDMECAA